jgi:hypothetical protein
MFQKSIELEQWNRRLRHAVALPGMTEEDARAIVAGELGDVKEEQVANLVKDAQVSDPRRNVTYISAGRLFAGIQEVLEDPRFAAKRQRSQLQ